MEKGIKTFHLIGYILEAVLALFFIFLFVISLIIALPTSKDIIMKGLQDGTISMNPAMSLDENIAYIQTSFIYFAIIIFILMAAYISNSVISFLITRHSDNKKLIISSLVLSIVGFNPILFVIDIILLKNNGIEVIEVK